MPVVPDDKDWTWVLARRCPECGFDAPPDNPSPSPRSCAPTWKPGGVALARPPSSLRSCRRPPPSWPAPSTPSEASNPVHSLYDVTGERVG
jgi:hypothetical protein